jgi:hypothetical protein
MPCHHGGQRTLPRPLNARHVDAHSVREVSIICMRDTILAIHIPHPASIDDVASSQQTMGVPSE